MNTNEKMRSLLFGFPDFMKERGWICNDKSNNNRIRLGIDQNDLTPLYIGQRIWGGSVRPRERISDKGKYAMAIIGD